MNKIATTILPTSIVHLRSSMSCRAEKPRINNVSLLAGITMEDAIIGVAGNVGNLTGYNALVPTTTAAIAFTWEASFCSNQKWT